MSIVDQTILYSSHVHCLYIRTTGMSSPCEFNHGITNSTVHTTGGVNCLGSVNTASAKESRSMDRGLPRRWLPHNPDSKFQNNLQVFRHTPRTHSPRHRGLQPQTMLQCGSIRALYFSIHHLILWNGFVGQIRNRTA